MEKRTAVKELGLLVVFEFIGKGDVHATWSSLDGYGFAHTLACCGGQKKSCEDQWSLRHFQVVHHAYL